MSGSEFLQRLIEGGRNQVYVIGTAGGFVLKGMVSFAAAESDHIVVEGGGAPVIEHPRGLVGDSPIFGARKTSASRLIVSVAAIVWFTPA